MEEDDIPHSDFSLLFSEKAKSFLSAYRLPLILGLSGLLLLFLAVFLLWRNQREEKEIIFSTEASSSAKNIIAADIEGAVFRPGVYQLPAGSRVQDLLVASGGLAAEADREWIAKNLNRAAKLIDGGKIYIPEKRETVPSQNKESQSLNNNPQLININSASLVELEGLPGIGPVTAQKIIASRPYQTLEELKSKKAVGESLFNKIKDLISLYP